MFTVTPSQYFRDSLGEDFDVNTDKSASVVLANTNEQTADNITTQDAEIA